MKSSSAITCHKNQNISQGMCTESDLKEKSPSPSSGSSSRSLKATTAMNHSAMNQSGVIPVTHTAPPAGPPMTRSSASVRSMKSCGGSSTPSVDLDSIYEEFASRPCVRAALATPCHPHSVLSFFTGVDFADSSSAENTNLLSLIPYPLVKHSSRRYSKLCQPFAPVIRAAASGRLVSTDDCNWESVDGTVARIVLCSQIAKSCFRGTAEAYSYDEISVKLCKELHTMASRHLGSSKQLGVGGDKSMSQPQSQPQSQGLPRSPSNNELRKSFASMSVLAAIYGNPNPEKKRRRGSMSSRYGSQCSRRGSMSSRRSLSTNRGSLGRSSQCCVPTRRVSLTQVIPPESVEVCSTRSSIHHARTSSQRVLERTPSSGSMSSLECDVEDGDDDKMDTTEEQQDVHSNGSPQNHRMASVCETR